jgi:hypothetical protein
MIKDPIKSTWIKFPNVGLDTLRVLFQAFSYYQGRLLLHIHLDRNITFFFPFVAEVCRTQSDSVILLLLSK